MAEDKPAEVPEAVAAAEEESKPAKRPRKSLKDELDQSAVLASGPRQRKKAEHFQVEVKEKAEFVIKAGKGSKLGEIPNVHFLLGKLKPDDELVTGLHNLLFKRPGTVHRRKKNLFEFSGLVIEGGDQAKELEKVKERLGKWTIGLLNSALDAFELPRGAGDEGKKEAKVERIFKFLEEPKKMSDKDLAAEAAKKKDAAAKKREKAQKPKTPKSAGKESARKRSKKSEDEGEDGEEPSEEEQPEAEEEEAEEQPKKKARKSVASPAKKAAEKKAPSAKKSTGKKRKADEEEGDGEKGAEELPSDEEIKEATLAALAVSDVNSTTVRDLLKMLNEKFGKDLSSKRALIKQVAVSYATAGSAAAGAEADKEGEDKSVREEAEADAKQETEGVAVADKSAEDAGKVDDVAEAAPVAASEGDVKADSGEEPAKEEEAKEEEAKEEEAKDDAEVKDAGDAKQEPPTGEGAVAGTDGAKEGQDAEMTEAKDSTD